jgi:hypothetical protein
MIVRILSKGKSFSGLANYLSHDADQAKTSERVAWTHTHNLANDDVPCAVNEMVWTARDAELLKQQAGIRAGGRATENTVKHFSLNWAPDDRPTREHMIDTTEDFLRRMQWQDHQAIVVAHNDKAYAHVHVMLNVVHPETGLRLNDDFERRRAQAWALEYERAQDRIHCEQRLKSLEEREAAMPRNIWVAFQENQKEFFRAENSLRENDAILRDDAKNRRNSEWQILKEIQRNERTAFFADGKLQFSELRLSIYREVREEFREKWADFYSARRNGADPDSLAALKAEIVAEQKTVLETRRDEACKTLRESRDVLYRHLLDDQKEARADLRSRQEVGLDNAPFLAAMAERSASEDVTPDFRHAADEATKPQEGKEQAREATFDGWFENEDGGGTSPGHTDNNVGLRLGPGLGSFLAGIAYELINAGSARPEPRRGPAGSNSFRASAAEVVKRQHRERDEEDAKGRQKERSTYGE